MKPCIRFTNVSKRFQMEQSRPRSWQERLVNLFKHNSHKSDYQYFWVLRDINFEIQPGETISLIGSNGAGKSTMLKLLTSIIRPTYGTIEINGRMSALLELGAGFHPDLTGRENIYLNGAILGLSRVELEQKIRRIIEFAELERFIDVPVRNYSSGMYVRLGFAVAVYTDPEILIVDEVLAVGDAAFQRKCMERIHQMRHQGVTIILVTHDMATVQKLCQRAIWLYNGQIQAEGEVNDVVNQYNWFSYEEKSLHQVNIESESDTKEGDNHKEEPDLTEDTGSELEQELAEETESDPKSGEAPSDKQSQHRWGSGEITIETVTLLDDIGQPRNYYRTGEKLTIELAYKATTRIEHPIFGMAIHRSDGVHITGPNTRFANREIKYVEGEGVIQYTVPTIPLLEGTYHISVAVHNWEDTEMYDYHHQLYPFQVVPITEGEKYGLMTLKGDWFWQNGS